MATGPAMSSGNQSLGCAKVLGAFALMGVGLLLLAAAVGWLLYNEDSAVRATAANQAFPAIAVTIDPANPLPTSDGKAIHFSGRATGGTISDPLLGVSVEGNRLKRTVEMYQWSESVRSVGRRQFDGTERRETVYDYGTRWSETLIDSDRFRTVGGHENPKSIPFQSAQLNPPAIHVGQLVLPPKLAEKATDLRKHKLAPDAIKALPPEWRGSARVDEDGVLLLASRPGGPVPEKGNGRIGELRISFEAAPAMDVTVMGSRSGLNVTPYTGLQAEVLDLRPGVYSLTDSASHREAIDVVATWVMRIVGTILGIGGAILLLVGLKILGRRGRLGRAFGGAGLILVGLVLGLATTLIATGSARLGDAAGIASGLLAGGGVMLAAAIFIALRRSAQVVPPTLPAQPVYPNKPVY